MAKGDPGKGTEKREGKTGAWNYGPGYKEMEGTASEYNSTCTLKY